MHTTRVRTLADYAPPSWLAQLLSTRPVPVPYGAALRAVLILIGPLAVGMAIGRPELGAAVSTGGFPIVLADAGGAYRQRSFELGGAAAAASVGYLVGLFTSAIGGLTSVALVLLAVLSVLVGRIGAGSPVAGMLLLVFGVIGAGMRQGELGPAWLLGGFLVGVCWGLGVALSGWVVRGTAPERDAVAGVFVALAVLLDSGDPATARAARHQLTVSLNTAYDRLLRARARIPGRHAKYRGLLTVLTQATPVVEAAVALINSGERAPRAVVDHLTATAAAVLAGAELPRAPRPEFEYDSPGLTALYGGLAKLGAGSERAPRDPASLRAWIRSLGAGLTLDRLTVNAMLRIGFCVALAEAVSVALPMENTHWVTLTVAIVLRPELGSVFERAVLRGVGTVVGVAIGALVLAAHPQGWLLLGIAAVFAAAVPIGKALNYGLLSAAITPLIIIELDIQYLGDMSVLVERLTHSILGCLIVLSVGFWLWPGSLRPRIGGRVADTLVAVREYLDGALWAGAMHAGERSRARRRAYRALTELRAAFAQLTVEPSAAGRQASAWWPAIVGLERVVDAVTVVVVAADHGSELPADRHVTALVDAVDELIDAVRTGRVPVPLRLDDAGVLGEVASELAGVFETFRGPRLR